GFEGVGVIERAGPGVPEQMIGRRVLPIGSAGCWAERKQTPLSWCIPVPEDLPDAAAAGTAYINPLTAWLMVERFCAARVREVVDASGRACRDRVRQLAGGRSDVVLDCVGGAQGALLMVRLDPGGVVVHYCLQSCEPLPRACFDWRRGTRVELFLLLETVHSM